ncbi:MAG: glycogen synthase GlgA [Betaproteobacteria bacterium]|nr:glycogen synthase GlgA [Betaproteobacteria bacterium]
MRVLHVAAEAFPAVKTGGLADVVSALPAAMSALGTESTLLLPGYPAVLDSGRSWHALAQWGPALGAAKVTLLRGEVPGIDLPVWAVDAPWFYRRSGGPYHNPQGEDWPDNAQRFALLGWVAAQITVDDGLGQNSSFDLVHAHDWHAALTCAYLALRQSDQVPSVFTVHNLAYQGLFPYQDHALLGLPSQWMTPAGMEFHGRLSFMKAGLQFANRITTVSPTYSREIASVDHGHGLDGVIRGRLPHVRGILNGIDDQVWDPSQDRFIAKNYSALQLAGKVACKQALCAEVGVPYDPQVPLLACVSRLSSQKGIDLMLASLPDWIDDGVQVVVQGSGDTALEMALRHASARYPGRFVALVGYDEARAHRILAGSDALLVPSRFEPCGLTQMYAMRYGSIPVVRRTGGLADTVIDISDGLAQGQPGTGLCFEQATAKALTSSVRRLLALFKHRAQWQQVQQRGMAMDWSWRGPAQAYQALYEETLRDPYGSLAGEDAEAGQVATSSPAKAVAKAPA